MTLVNSEIDPGNIGWQWIDKTCRRHGEGDDKHIGSYPGCFRIASCKCKNESAV